MKRSIRASGKSRAENWGLRSPFFCLSKGQRHLKTKTDTAGDGICRHLFFYTNFRDGCGEIQETMGSEEEGFIMSATELLQSGKEYSDDEIRKLLSGHLCRCTGYENIFRAVKKTMLRRLGKDKEADEV